MNTSENTMCVQGAPSYLHPTLDITVCVSACGVLRQHMHTLAAGFLDGHNRRERYAGEVCKGCRKAKEAN